MLEEHKQELDALMGMYKDDLEGLKTKRAEERETQDKFKQEFEKLKHEIVWPVLVDVGNELTNYGHDFQVTEEPDYVDTTARYHSASITFNIYPATLGKTVTREELTPYISFIANPYAHKVNITVSTMMPGEEGVIGSVGECELSEITPDFVEDEIVEVLKNSLFLHQKSSE